MTRDSRRSFLQKAAATGFVLSATRVLAPFLRAQGSGCSALRTLPALDRNIFGSFLAGTDLKTVNDLDKPENVVPQAADKPLMDGNVTKLELPPRSYSLYQWGV